jgi:hypothetical protein
MLSNNSNKIDFDEPIPEMIERLKENIETLNLN